MQIFFTVLIFILVFIFFASILLGYYGLYRMCELADVKHPWLSYIPLVNFFVVGKLIETIDVPGYRIPKAEWVMPLLPVLFSLGFFFNIWKIPMLILSLACVILWLYGWQTFFLIYAYQPKKALLYTMLGSLLVFPKYLWIFKLRNQKPFYEL